MQVGDGEKQLIAQVDRELKQYINCMEKTRMRDAIKYLLNISRLGNFYIQSNKPWELVKKSPAEKALAGTVLGLSANICCLLCTLMEPYMPDTCANLKSQLNTERIHHVLIDDFVCLLPSGHKIGKPSPLFKKIEQDVINELKTKYAGRQSQEKETVPPSKETKAAVPASNMTNGVDLQALEASVTEQGEKVRSLKVAKADKASIDKEVALLLQLKREVMIAKGENPDQQPAKSKNK
ncbi:methionine--tRNA ligase, cytoplasmic, partial [Parasteatoda tepidariorum]|uniref:methionine--tRNA ligase, cytoplasmic n=1 Tax=Parasteatoda tepidariorum TaxID=114398 RepID=UPI001C724412